MKRRRERCFSFGGNRDSMGKGNGQMGNFHTLEQWPLKQINLSYIYIYNIVFLRRNLL